jgi:WD40 repeat protein
VTGSLDSILTLYTLTPKPDEAAETSAMALTVSSSASATLTAFPLTALSSYRDSDGVVNCVSLDLNGVLAHTVFSGASDGSGGSEDSNAPVTNAIASNVIDFCMTPTDLYAILSSSTNEVLIHSLNSLDKNSLDAATNKFPLSLLDPKFIAVTANSIVITSSTTLTSYSLATLKLMYSAALLNSDNGDSDRITCVTTTPQGLTCLGTASGVIHVHDHYENGKLVGVLKGHNGWITGIAFHDDNRRITSCSADSSIKVWDLTTHQVLHTFEGGHVGQVTAMDMKDTTGEGVWRIVGGDEKGVVSVCSSD